MAEPIRILLQTTIASTEDDWSIFRFSLLQDYLKSIQDKSGKPLFTVLSRDRSSDADGNDPILGTLDQSDFDELWLFALDTGDGLTDKDIAGINAFRKRGGGILTTRDHQDMGCSMCGLIDIGDVHYFNTKNPDLTIHVGAVMIHIQRIFPGLTTILELMEIIKKSLL